MSELLVKRIYDPPVPGDGYRVLVDRLWPRGMTRARAAVDDWLKDIAPTPDLRRWWDHDPARIDEFARRYTHELDGNSAVDRLRLLRRENERVTLLYAAHDPRVNHAVILRDYLTRLDDRAP